jgi:hypothetical protein
VLGWYLYTVWMGLCGIYFQTLLSFIAVISGSSTWNASYKNGAQNCQNYIAPYI